MRLTVFYSVQNSGDGCAYPKLMESKELAVFDQRHMIDGWEDICIGSFSFESDSTIRCLQKIITKEQYYIDNYSGNCNSRDKIEFIKAFFPNGLPKFEIIAIDDKNGYTLNDIIINNKHVASVFRTTKMSGKVFEDLLNETT